MPPRGTYVIYFGDEAFAFFIDSDVLTGLPVLHITLRHGAMPSDAIRTFLVGNTTWNEAHARWETTSATHTLYWARYPRDGSIMVITCFPYEGVRNGQIHE